MTSRHLVTRAVILACLATACLKPAEVPVCGDFTCGAFSVCSPDGTRCVSPDVVAACQGKADGDGCSFPGLDVGTCADQLCVASGCGNGVIEPGSNEVCDDGNRTAGDGCSADCRSTELCGDGIVDPFELEQCDCGSDLANLPLGCTGVNADTPNAQCRTSCKPARCGDTIVDAPNEGCDDGNTIAGDGCAADCSGRWTRMQSNTLAYLKSVWAASSTDAWAVGENRIMRWDGTRWYQQPAIDTTLRDYDRVCGLNPQDVFVTADNKIYRYHPIGTANPWTDVTPSTGYVWPGLHCRGSNVWIAGYLITNNNGAFARWNGSAFAPLLGSLDLNAVQLHDIWESLDGTLFAADDTGSIHRASPNHANWPIIGPSKGMRISGTTSSDITAIAPPFNTAAAHHYDGLNWSLLIGSDEFTAQGVSTVPNATPSTTLLVGGLGGILTCTATSCAVSATETPVNLNGVWALSPTQAFVVGGQGTILY